MTAAHGNDTHPRARPATRPARLALPLLASAWLAGCAATVPAPDARAVATLSPTAGNRTSGAVSFSERGGRTLVTATIQGLAPGAEHGFHVHEKGDCSSPDAMSAGGHFNPGGAPHGHPASATRHAGDMPNLRANAQGTATLQWESDQLRAGSGPNGVVGRAVVVHRNADDYHSQPAGEAGPRLACGVIRAS